MREQIEHLLKLSDLPNVTIQIVRNNCVELAGAAGVVAVRDSKDPDGPVLLVTRAALRAAVRSVAKVR
ncbi:DUF397 domain-containing protein [Actinomadura sp. 7K534]|uniref:DUF397 domain-containing protein n=1 Tax=Actinomadura sp. 7K534 TaxID=2530366 RepID=UPI0010470F04|nr:DUF397 domain-containing protein [Actinomadura sp. 7K534]TDB88251.1 DUF397 domain-containing protein [Actinomadura sp. 7K534]